MTDQSETVQCKKCGTKIVPAKQSVPEYGGLGGVKTEYRCPSCGAIISTEDIENK